VRNELRKIKLIKRAIEDEIDLINSILNEAKAEMEEQSNQKVAKNEKIK